MLAHRRSWRGLANNGIDSKQPLPSPASSRGHNRYRKSQTDKPKLMHHLSVKQMTLPAMGPAPR